MTPHRNYEGGILDTLPFMEPEWLRIYMFGPRLILIAIEDLGNARHDLTATPLFPKTHDLEDLSELCVRIAGTLASAMVGVTPLTESAARFRYPGAPRESTLREALESIKIARLFVDAVLKRRPVAARQN